MWPVQPLYGGRRCELSIGYQILFEKLKCNIMCKFMCNILNNCRQKQVQSPKSPEHIKISTESTFNEHCPLAYTLINEVHWHDPDARHSRNETFIRHLLKIYVVEGSTLDQLFRKNCTRCRLHQKKTEVSIRP